MSGQVTQHPPVMCRRVGCTRPATHHLEFRAWTADTPKLAATALAGRVPQPLCKEHAKEATPQGVLTETGLATINKALESRGRGPASWESILVFPVDGIPQVTLAGLPAPSAARH